MRRADALCTRHVGQLDFSGDVADGIDALNAGAEGFVGDDSSTLAGYLKADGKQSLRIGAAADGDQNLLGTVAVHRRQDALHRLHDGHLAAQRSKDAGKLHADDTAADDEDFLCKAVGLGKLRVVQQFVAGDDAWQVESWNRRAGRNRTGRDQNIFCMKDFFPLA